MSRPAQGWPPVPGQPWPKWTLPTTNTAVAGRRDDHRPREPAHAAARERPGPTSTPAGSRRAAPRRRTRGWRRTSRASRLWWRARRARTIASRSSAETRSRRQTPGTPIRAQPTAARPQRICCRGSSASPVRPARARRAEQTGSDDVCGPRGRARTLGHVVDQQLRELLAIASAPGSRIAAHQALGASRSCVGAAGSAHPARGPEARRRRPTSATWRWASRCARSASAPSAVSR